MVVINFVLVFVSGKFPGWLPPANPFNGYIHDCHQRIALAKYQYSRGEIDPKQPLCVIIGASTGRVGIKLSKLSERDGLPYKYLGLCAAGHKINILASIAEPILRGDLKPDLAILVVSPHQMKHFGSGVPREPWNWVKVHRHDVECAISRQADRVRHLLFNTFQVTWDQQCCALKPSDLPHGITVAYLQEQEDPFREMMVSSWKRSLTPEQLAVVAAGYRSRGYSESKRYPRYASQLQQFIELIDEFHRIRTKVIVVLPPESATLRDMVVQEASANLKHALHNTYGADVPLLDAREELPDEYFHDLGHLNSAGRAKFTELLARQIGNHIPEQIPLMTEREQIARRATDRDLSGNIPPVKSTSRR